MEVYPLALLYTNDFLFFVVSNCVPMIQMVQPGMMGFDESKELRNLLCDCSHAAQVCLVK